MKIRRCLGQYNIEMVQEPARMCTDVEATFEGNQIVHSLVL